MGMRKTAFLEWPKIAVLIAIMAISFGAFSYMWMSKIPEIKGMHIVLKSWTREAPSFTVKVSELRDEPSKFDGSIVVVRGAVTFAARLPELGREVWTLQDGTGSIDIEIVEPQGWQNGETITVEGVFLIVRR